MREPTILLTNDDGIHSPGILAAAEALLPLGRVVVAAPRQQQTSMGRAYCGSPDARLEPVEFIVGDTRLEAYACDASPAAVVRHAVLCLSDVRPSLVVAGINYGENIGTNVTGSGTVGATLEAASRRIPALAVSLETDVDSHHCYTEQDWTGSVHFTRLFARSILEKGLVPGVGVLKVEVPAGATPQTSWKMTRLSPNAYYEANIDSPSPASCRRETVFTKRKDQGEDSPDTDAYAVRTARCVAVTPLGLDLTAAVPLESVTAWIQAG